MVISKQIKIPSNVTVKLVSSKLVISGPKGLISLNNNTNFLIQICEEKSSLIFFSKKREKVNLFNNNYFFSKINNIIKGVSVGFFLEMKLNGVGYRFLSYKEKELKFKAGFCNDLVYCVPENVNVFLESPIKLCFYSSDYDLLKKVGAQIKSLKKPDSYKGKGLSYVLENLVLKEVKKS